MVDASSVADQSERAVAPRVVVVEDDAPLRRFVHVSLRQHGYLVTEACNAAEALAVTEQHAVDLMLLDLGLPDRDGLSVIAAVRAKHGLPIIVLSAREQEASKVEALDAGADDYLTKPFGVDELLARIRVALRHAARREAPGGHTTFTCGPLLVDFIARRVTLEGCDVHVTPLEYRLLSVLVANVDRVVTHRALLEKVWGKNGADHTQYLRVYMAHLRRKLERDPSNPSMLLTEAGVGYRLKC